MRFNLVAEIIDCQPPGASRVNSDSKGAPPPGSSSAPRRAGEEIGELDRIARLKVALQRP